MFSVPILGIFGLVLSSMTTVYAYLTAYYRIGFEYRKTEKKSPKEIHILVNLTEGILAHLKRVNEYKHGSEHRPMSMWSSWYQHRLFVLVTCCEASHNSFSKVVWEGQCHGPLVQWTKYYKKKDKEKKTLLFSFFLGIYANNYMMLCLVKWPHFLGNLIKALKA